MQRVKDSLLYFLTSLLDFIYPPLCVACGKEIEKGLICEDCLTKLTRLNIETCPECGEPVFDRNSHRCREPRLKLKRVRTLGRYNSPRKELIGEFKYHHKPSLAKILGKEMGVILNSDPVLKTSDLLVPIPLHPARKRERGYNQAELLAEEISKFTYIPFSNCLKRVKNTKAQVTLSERERLENVREAFKLKKGADISGKRVILIDDVFTTGATLNAAALSLIEGGAEEVYGLTVAAAHSGDDSQR